MDLFDGAKKARGASYSLYAHNLQIIVSIVYETAMLVVTINLMWQALELLDGIHFYLSVQTDRNKICMKIAWKTYFHQSSPYKSLPTKDKVKSEMLISYHSRDSRQFMVVMFSLQTTSHSRIWVVVETLKKRRSPK